MAKSKRTKACEIPRKVKVEVYARDNECCVLCGKWVDIYHANAHYIPRSQGGLGIEENILTLCPDCHRLYDQSHMRSVIKDRLCLYLKSKHENWNVKDLYYNKQEAICKR